MDYRTINNITIKDAYLIPTVDEIFDELHRAHYFSKIDLKFGLHQIYLIDDSIPASAFQTHDGHFKFRVMPFDLCNAPSTF